MEDATLFQYCPKIVLLRNGDSEVLLARRKGEADYDKTYAFIGGKTETIDGGLLEGLRREKNEEIGQSARVKICPYLTFNIYFVKRSGRHMIVPHHYARFVGGAVNLSDEYGDFKWVTLARLSSFEPKIPNIPDVISWLKRLQAILKPGDFIEI